MLVLGISGSLRRDSYNAMLLASAAELLAPKVELEQWPGLAAIPPYSEDLDLEPASVHELRDALTRADAVLIATPEYNHSVPGQLKNALDWASRPFPNPAREARRGHRRQHQPVRRRLGPGRGEEGSGGDRGAGDRRGAPRGERARGLRGRRLAAGLRAASLAGRDHRTAARGGAVAAGARRVTRRPRHRAQASTWITRSGRCRHGGPVARLRPEDERGGGQSLAIRSQKARRLGRPARQDQAARRGLGRGRSMTFAPALCARELVAMLRLTVTALMPPASRAARRSPAG